MKQEVLIRVRSIYYMRTFLRPVAIELSILLVAAVAISFLISVPSVIANMLRSKALLDYFVYLENAFVHTRITVKLALVAAFIPFVLLGREASRSAKLPFRRFKLAH